MRQIAYHARRVAPRVGRRVLLAYVQLKPAAGEVRGAGGREPERKGRMVFQGNDDRDHNGNLPFIPRVQLELLNNMYDESEVSSTESESEWWAGPGREG